MGQSGREDQRDGHWGQDAQRSSNDSKEKVPGEFLWGRVNWLLITSPLNCGDCPGVVIDNKKWDMGFPIGETWYHGDCQRIKESYVDFVVDLFSTIWQFFF